MPVDRLQALEPLRKNEEGVLDAKKRGRVQLADVLATLPHLSPQVATMVVVQYVCGMRPQDVRGIRPRNIDRSGPVWLYRPDEHKGDWRDGSAGDLVKAIPAAVQPILAPLLATEIPRLPPAADAAAASDA